MPSALRKAETSRYADYLDTKAQILEKLGDLSRYEICNNEVLLAIYPAPRAHRGAALFCRTRI